MDDAELLAKIETEFGWIAIQLGNIHAYTEICLAILEETKLSEIQAAAVAKLRKELTKSQDAFLARFSDWGKPGAN